MLQIATPDALIRLKNSAKLQDEYDKIVEVYSEQHHSSLSDFLRYHLLANVQQQQLGCRMQVNMHINCSEKKRMFGFF